MKISKDKLVFRILGVFLIILITVFCVVPFVLIVTGSMTSQASILRDGYRFVPKEISFEAYKIIFDSPNMLLKAYAVTIGITVIGALLGLFLTSMASYVLVSKDFKYRNHFSFYFYFTTIFGGGLVPWYIMMVKYLKMKNTYTSLVSVAYEWYIYTPVNFMKSIPDAILSLQSWMVQVISQFCVSFFLFRNHWQPWVFYRTKLLE